PQNPKTPLTEFNINCPNQMNTSLVGPVQKLSFQSFSVRSVIFLISSSESEPSSDRLGRLNCKEVGLLAGISSCLSN
ncbi:MAG: hypothetical protein ACKO96_23130, partial [Flammeovirgaceae bacterium]